MAILKSKGTILKFTISSVLTAIPQITSIDKDGEESETMDTRALDSAVGLPIDTTGFVKPCTITANVNLDLTAASTHTSIVTAMRTPPTAGTVMALVRTDAGPVTETWTCKGIKFKESMEGTKPITGTFVFAMTGSAS